MKTTVLPFACSLSFFALIFTVCGKVALNNKICFSVQHVAKIFSMVGKKKSSKSLSASSMDIILHCDKSAIWRSAKSQTRPGVPTSTWTGVSRRKISSS